MSSDSREPINSVSYPSYNSTTPPEALPPSTSNPLPYPTSDSAPALPYPTSDSPAGAAAPGALDAAPALPYPTSDSSATTASPGAPSAPTALPYPTSDPAYPPPAVTSSEASQQGTSSMPNSNAPQEGNSSNPPTNGLAQNAQVEGGKPVELPAYTEPPPSYAATFPEASPPQPQAARPAYPPAGYTAQAQYVAPQPQQMIRTLGATPVQVECPRCHQQVLTRVNYVSGALTYIVVFVCILFGGFLGCCLIPFCIDGLKDVHHYCPNCKNNLGRYDRLS